MCILQAGFCVWRALTALENFTFWHNSMFRALALSVALPWDSPFLQGALVPFHGNRMEERSLVLGVLVAASLTAPEPLV